MNKYSIILSFLRKINQGFKSKVLAIFLFGLLNSLFQGIGIVLIIPLLEAYNSGKQSSNKVVNVLNDLGWNGELEQLLIFYFFILIGFAVFKALYSYYSQVVVSKFSNDIAVSGLRNVLNSKWDFFLKVSPSQLINLFNTEARSVKMLSFSGFRLLQSGFLVFIQLFLALYISWQLTIGTLVLLSVLYIVQRRLINKGFSLGRDRISLNEKMQLLLSETFQSIKFLALHNLTKEKGTEYKNRVDDLYKNDLKRAKLDAISEVIFIGVGSLIIVSIIYVGLTNALISVNELLVLLVLLLRAIGQTQALLKTLNSFMSQLPSFKRFNEVLSLSESYQKIKEESNSSLKIQSHIELKNVSFNYHEKQVIIDDFNKTFHLGKSYLFFGESGKGKTTLLDIIAGLIESKKGSVLIDGKPFESFGNEMLSYVLQDTILFEGTLRDNITSGNEYSDAQLYQAIQKAELSPLISRLPQGIDTVVQEGGKGFSGGEKQRIAIARALIRNSQILLLDEITSALDAQNETKILETLSKLKEDRIIIIVAHRERIKDWADEVIYFS